MFETLVVIAGVVIAAAFVGMRVTGALGLRRGGAQPGNCAGCSEQSTCADADPPEERLTQLRRRGGPP